MNNVEDLTNERGGEAMLAMGLGAAISELIAGEKVEVSGAALGLALGRWVTMFGPILKDQERALDRVLVVAARAAAEANAK